MLSKTAIALSILMGLLISINTVYARSCPPNCQNPAPTTSTSTNGTNTVS